MLRRLLAEIDTLSLTNALGILLGHDLIVGAALRDRVDRLCRSGKANMEISVEPLDMSALAFLRMSEKREKELGFWRDDDLQPTMKNFFMPYAPAGEFESGEV
jgi:hypothetical protein